MSRSEQSCRQPQRGEPARPPASTAPPRPRRRAAAGVLAAAALLAAGTAGCSHSSAPEAEDDTARVVAVAGTDRSRVILTASAVQHLGIVTRPAGRTEVGFGALFYDDNGQAWVYTNPTPRTYLRVPVTVARIEGDRVLLRDPLPAGTTVVTTGAAELRGAEYGVDGE